MIKNKICYNCMRFWDPNLFYPITFKLIIDSHNRVIWKHKNLTLQTDYPTLEDIKQKEIYDGKLIKHPLLLDKVIKEK